MKDHNHRNIKIVFAAVSIFWAVGFLLWTVFPELQIAAFFSNYVKAQRTGDASYLTDKPWIFNPTSVQPILRNQFMELMISVYVSTPTDPGDSKLFMFSIAKLEDSLTRKNDYVNDYLYTAMAYDALGDSAKDRVKASDYYAKATDDYEKTLELMPDYQPAIKLLAINLYNRGLGNAGIFLLQDAIKRDPGIPELHFYLGVIEAKEGDSYAGDSLAEMELALSQNADLQESSTRDLYVKLAATFAKNKDKARLITTLSRLKLLDPEHAASYDEVLTYIAKNNKIPVLDVNLK